MPLALMESGSEATIKRVGGNDSVKKHLTSLGFTPGCEVRMVNSIGGNVIVQIMDSRIAISKEMALKITV